MTSSEFSTAALRSNLASSKLRGKVVLLTSSDVARVLSAFLEGAVSEKEMTDWAEFYDGNEDVEFESEKLLPDVLFELSSPEINGRLQPERAHELLSLLLGP